MTERELNEVRELRLEIDELSERLNQLRLNATHITQLLDGMPRAPNLRPKLERMTVEIAEAERKLATLHERLLTAKERLTSQILDEVNDRLIQGLLILRYVNCLSFRKIARLMRISLRYVYKLHKKFFAQFTPCSPPVHPCALASDVI